MKSKPELTFRVGNRVRLRLPHEDDLQLLTTWMNDPEVTQYILHYIPQTMDSEREWLKKLHPTPNDFVFGIETEDETLIGLMGLHHVHYIHGTANTGAFIGDKTYWGKGYGSEAKMLLLKYAFDTLGLRKICASVIAFNGRSQRYQEKCGYKVEGVRKAQLFKNGQYWDEVLFACFREDWLPVWEHYQETGEIH
jgi:RimJ/RimL family protein N-acetyltransferase